MSDRRLHPSFLFFLALLLFFPALGGRDFWAPVEPRYAEIARIMFDKGEWIVPTVNGDLYTDKPTLFFWLIVIFSKLAGSVNEWTVRLPAALGALGLVMTTYKLGKSFFTPRLGFLAAAVLATSMRVIWEGRWAHVDSLFTFFFALSMFFAGRALLLERNRNQMLMAYAFMALATLTKGLIGVVLPGLILMTFIIARKDWRLLRETLLVRGIMIFSLIAAPWFVWVSLATDGQWLKDFFYVHHLQRYTAGMGHRQPLYYYLTTLPVDFLPWTIFALPALFAYRWRVNDMAEPVRLFFTLWFVSVLVFFTLSDTKRDLYLLPLFPPLALFVGSYLSDLIAGNLSESRLYRILTVFFFNCLWIGSLALPIAAWFVRRDAIMALFPFALATTCGGLGAAYFTWRRRPGLVFVSTAFTMLAGVLTTAIWFLPFLDQFKSPRPFAVEVSKRVAAQVPLYVYADTMHDFNFYAKREIIPVLSSPSDVQRLLAQDQLGYLLIKEKDRNRSGLISDERIVLSEGTPGRVWLLVALKARGFP